MFPKSLFIFLTLCLFSIRIPAETKGDFELVVKPFFKEYCTRCHGPKKQKGKLALHTVFDNFDTEPRVNLWISVLNQLTFKEMPPPEKKPQPSSKDSAKVVQWINKRLEETGKGETYRKKLLAPEYGNWVNHEALFSGEIKTLPFSPSRLWRISPEIYKHKGLGSSPHGYITPKSEIRDYAAMSGVDLSSVQMLLINAEAYVQKRKFQGFSEGSKAPSDDTIKNTVRGEFQRIIGRAPDKSELEKYLNFMKRNIADGGSLPGLQNTIKAIFLSPEAIYRMELGLGKTDKQGRRQLSAKELAYSIAYTLTDRGPLHNKILKAALEKKTLNDKGNVKSLVRQVLDEQLGKGHWDRPDLPRIMRFFDQYFGYDRAGTVFKDNDRKRKENIPQWNTNMMIHDIRTLIMHILKADNNVVQELLTTNKYFVAHPGSNEYAKEHYEKHIAELKRSSYVEERVFKKKAQLEKNNKMKPEEIKKRLTEEKKSAEKAVSSLKEALKNRMNPFPGFPFTNRSRGIGDLIYIEPYNLPSSGRNSTQRWNWPVKQPFEMPKEQRAGILTHPAWLAAHSLNDGNDPIHRGIWVRKKLLAGVLGDVPPDVDASVPSDPHRTLRERLDVIRDEKCWRCHRKMNPLGETFEIFDDWGRYRTKIFFDEKKEIYRRRDNEFKRKLEQKQLSFKPVNATGAITGSGDPKVDGDVNDAIEMIHRLAKSDRVRQSFIRHLFRYIMGRNEMLSDSKTLREADQAYLKSGGSFKELVVSLISSDSFIYRK